MYKEHIKLLNAQVFKALIHAGTDAVKVIVERRTIRDLSHHEKFFPGYSALAYALADALFVAVGDSGVKHSVAHLEGSLHCRVIAVELGFKAVAVGTTEVVCTRADSRYQNAIVKLEILHNLYPFKYQFALSVAISSAVSSKSKISRLDA